MDNLKAKLQERVSSIQQTDKQLSDELKSIRRKNAYKEEAKKLAKKIPKDTGGLESVNNNEGLALETIVLRVGRPVLAVDKNEAVLDFKDAESAVWKQRLLNAKEGLSKAIRSVGRVELQNHPFFDWVGTGWLVADNVLVTNRHVAEVFGRSNGTGFVFRQGSDGTPVTASIDFLEEIANGSNDATYVLDKILYIEREPGPDLAFLKVIFVGGKENPGFINLSLSPVETKTDIAVIGYPASDSRIPDQQLMTDIFGNVYNKKRLAPGQITGVSADQLLHDGTTLGGNSGSALIDLKTGNAIGLHFAGRFLEANFAVSAALIKNRLDKLGNGAIINGSKPFETKAKSQTTSSSMDISPAATQAKTAAAGNGKHAITFDYNIPIKINVSIELASQQNATASAATISSLAIDEDEEFFTEGRPEDFADRTGYEPDFLGKKFTVPLPEVKSAARKKDVLTFTFNDVEEDVLKYEHFSVRMSKSRRQCFYSAVNIDGKTSASMKRGAWRLDPRIPAEAQIMKECYGNPPKFSRGHMTRREDPIWGDTDIAARGNTDSMHVTNTVPQMQTMNGGIWLGLENFALQNARKDDMRISVFTGPVFRGDDPVQFGISIPLTFWKVIVFIHDETKKLCATGYEISQKDFISENEFVFGQHKTAQRKISKIEKDTGLSFGELTSIDPLNNRDDEAPDTVIMNFDQIKFV